MAKLSFLILFVWSVKRNSNASTGKIKNTHSVINTMEFSLYMNPLRIYVEFGVWQETKRF